MNNDYKNIGHTPLVELPLPSGKVIYESFDKEKIYNLRSTVVRRLRFKSSFPFIWIDKRPASQFKYRTVYTYTNSMSDKTYTILIPIRQLFDHLEISYKQYSFRDRVMGDVAGNNV